MALEIAEGIYRIETAYQERTGIPLYLFLIVTDEQVALIDTAVPGIASAALRPFLRSLGLQLSDITLIMNTHGHPDHFGGNYEIKRASKARLLASRRDAAWIENHERLWAELWAAFREVLDFCDATKKEIMRDCCGRQTKVDRYLRSGEPIRLGRNHILEVVATPGHSPGHVSFYDAMHKLLFTGDAVQGRGIPTTGHPPVAGPLYTDVDAYVQSLERLMLLDIDYLLGAHWPVLRKGGARRLLRESISYAIDVDGYIKTELLRAEGPPTITQIAEGIGGAVTNAGGLSL